MYEFNLTSPLQLGSSFHSPTTLPTSPSKDRNAGDRFIPSRMGNNWDVDYNVGVSMTEVQGGPFGRGQPFVDIEKKSFALV